MSNTPDVVLIGSGINALVCAALLSKRGRKVLVLERSGILGGCMRTAALTAPGFRPFPDRGSPRRAAGWSRNRQPVHHACGPALDDRRAGRLERESDHLGHLRGIGLRAIIEENGGTCRTGCDVEEIIVEPGKAAGVRIAGGGTVAADRIVAPVTPVQLYQRLLHDLPGPGLGGGSGFLAAQEIG